MARRSVSTTRLPSARWGRDSQGLASRQEPRTFYVCPTPPSPSAVLCRHPAFPRTAIWPLLTSAVRAVGGSQWIPLGSGTGDGCRRTGL